jgi:SAM-dependent methyltransferase
VNETGGTKLKAILWAVTPPLLWRSAKAVRDRVTATKGESVEPGQQDASYYDRLYARQGAYHQHYSTSPYYFLWSVIADRLLRAEVTSVLDVGCGAGQFAGLLRDRGLKQYCGFDFSSTAIRMARSVCPDWEFVAADALETDLFQTRDYQAVVCTEVLEHIESDIGLLKRVPANVLFFGSVPNFPDTAHVRFFPDCQAVLQRYGSLLRGCRVDALAYGDGGRQLYVLEGVRS